MNIAYDVEFDLDSFLDLMRDKTSHRDAPDADLGKAQTVPEQPQEPSVGAPQGTSDA